MPNAAAHTSSRGAISLSYLDPSYFSIGRNNLEAQVPNPLYGKITDPIATNLNRPTIQRYRLLRPVPQFGGTSVGTSEPAAANSYYHGLQMKYEKRFSKGLTFLGHYTWSKMIDDASVASGNVTWLGGTTAMQNPFDRRNEKSLSAHDIPHRAVFSGAYQLPFGRGREFGTGMNRWADLIVGGWEGSGFLTLQGGNPFQPALNARGPGIKTLDSALPKSFPTNTPIFADPATTWGANNFGQITGTKIGSRAVQLGFKYYF